MTTNDRLNSKSFTIRIPNDVWDALGVEATGRKVAVSVIIMEHLRAGPHDFSALVTSTPVPPTLPNGALEAAHKASTLWQVRALAAESRLKEEGESKLAAKGLVRALQPTGGKPTEFPARPVRQREHA